MASGTQTLPLSPEEYERRKRGLETLKGLSKAEHIEILRILQKHKTLLSENLNGTFFNLCLLDQTTYNDIELFMNFTQSNRKDLTERELYMSTLVTTSTAPDLSA